MKPVKTKLFVGVTALALLGLTGCDSNDRNRDYNTTTSRDASMDNTATATGSGSNRGYYVPEHRMGSGNYSATSGTSTYDGSTRPRHTSDPGMGMVDQKAKGDGCCAGSCDTSAKQN